MAPARRDEGRSYTEVASKVTSMGRPAYQKIGLPCISTPAALCARIRRPKSQPDPRPFLVLTAILDGSARPAAITRSHGDAMERAIVSTSGHDIAGLDLVELPPIAPPTFAALRKQL